MPTVRLKTVGRSPRDETRTRRVAQRLSQVQLDVDGTTIIVDDEGNLEVNLAIWVYNEIPTGTINGINDSFLLANTPVADSLRLIRNGLLQEAGATNDYVLSGTSIIFNAGAVPITGDKLHAHYQKAS